MTFLFFWGRGGGDLQILRRVSGRETWEERDQNHVQPFCSIRSGLRGMWVAAGARRWYDAVDCALLVFDDRSF